MRVFSSLFAIAVYFLAPGALADDDRRPGLGGAYTSRSLTVPYNSLAMVVGPGQPQLFGQRYGGRSFDGGIAYRRAAQDGPGLEITEEAWFHGGVVFGLTENLEAGALFLNFRITPDFAYSDFPVYINYAWRFENIDIGARFSFTTPAETSIWSFNPGMPLLIRLGGARIDAGVYVPVDTESPVSVGLNVPVRFTVNATPRLFFGVETGVVEPSFHVKNNMSAQLGALVGYSTVLGSRVADFTTSFAWDDFLILDPAEGVDMVQAEAFRVHLGVTFHQIVM